MNRRMVALLIGNGAYKQKKSTLSNPTNDAKDLAKTLEMGTGNGDGFIFAYTSLPLPAK
ncbi:MAG: hypothetical protein D3913_09650 [Candidatus Electrothrix sp. LOE1_4_5]|nr:hypothetical protein [Candidatus Electrothrix gigas]MCI5227563.1 hypothetical protein [Candidatus Electrothrix gigas]